MGCISHRLLRDPGSFFYQHPVKAGIEAISNAEWECLLGTIIALLACMSPFASFCISMTLNNNSNYSLCLDSNFPPLCDDSYKSLLAHSFSRNKRKYWLPCRSFPVPGQTGEVERQLVSRLDSCFGVWVPCTSDPVMFAHTLLCILQSCLRCYQL